MDLPERLVRLAVDYASTYPEEIEERIALQEKAAEEVRARTERHARLLAS
jgi:hypothetical protein